MSLLGSLARVAVSHALSSVARRIERLSRRVLDGPPAPAMTMGPSIPLDAPLLSDEARSLLAAGISAPVAPEPFPLAATEVRRRDGRWVGRGTARVG